MKNIYKIIPRLRILPALVISCLMLFLIGGCFGKPEPPSIDALFSPTPTLTLTPTIQWFPVTATPFYQPRPSSTPNPAANPAFGSLIFSDEKAMTGNWLSSKDTIGSVSVSDGSIALSVNSPRGTVSTLRSNTMITNFYFESVMTVGLCKNGDQVGILFRSAGSQSYYRLLFKCEGTVSLQVVTGGQPSTLIDWSLSDQLGPGLNSAVKVGIWTYGKEIRIYLNDQLLFETESTAFYDGSIGFYARAAGNTTVSVNYSAINVYETHK